MDEARPRPRGPSSARELIEAATIAVATILVAKHFLLEPYKVPTPSMQPTVMGSAEAGVSDRLAVDKWTYRCRDPRRFEVVVFKGPFDRSTSYVKRIVGLPGEWIRIHDGDLWTRASDRESWQILRKPRAVQEALWRELAPVDGVADWEIASGDGQVAANGSVALEAGATAEFRRSAPFVLDGLLDGYPEAIRARLSPVHPRAGHSEVRDLRLEATLRLSPQGTARIEFRTGDEQLSFSIGAGSARIGAQAPIELAAGPRELSVAVQRVDDRLELYVGDSLLQDLDLPPTDLTHTSIAIAALDGPVEFIAPRVFRDVYYTDAWAKVAETFVPVGHYFMLGDNSHESSDSRDWTLWRYEFTDATGATRELRAHYRGAEHPRSLVGETDEPRIWLRDEWGEPHLFPQSSASVLSPIEAPFVPRELVLGRALAVFWPLDPLHGIWRFKWVH
ncbi:MAG: signal peptidase I [Planctomycetes bacterium]|nr:signal peptidase I [Planctomycetota bacterium]